MQEPYDFIRWLMEKISTERRDGQTEFSALYFVQFDASVHHRPTRQIFPMMQRIKPKGFFRAFISACFY